ncbi:MAG TPA: ATP-binding protein, partial [Leptospiraceae bacterium]|nr:ATP-binding protein [Leptospiraceae bacterium]
YRTGGFWRNIYLGKAEHLERIRYNENISDLILCGMLFTMGIYHFGIFLLRRSEPASAYFGLFCFFLIFYNMTINDIFLKQVFPEMSFRTLLSIHCFSFTLPIPAMSLFVKRMFPSDFHRPVMIPVYAAVLAAGALILFLPTEIFSQIVQPMRLMIIISSLYLIYLLAKASLKGNYEAKVFLSGFIIFFISVGNDILRANHILNTEYLSSYGFMFFIMAQSFVLSRRSSEAFRLSGTLARELSLQNITLEQKNRELRMLKSSLEDMVADRTKELLAAKENAELAANARYRFLANMSHEIRTPLNSIIGLTDLLLEAELKSEERDMAETVNSSGKLLLRIINDILDLSKIESGKVDLEETDFNLSYLAAEIASMIDPLIKSSGKNIRFYHIIDSKIPDNISGDPFRLKQILLNLLSNSVKFTEAGEIRFETRLISEENESFRLEFTVTDTGIGMNDSEIRKIFEPFVQADSSTTRKYGGTGLGLVIVRRLTESMGGKTSVESEKGKGSIFRLEIPFRKASAVNDISIYEPLKKEKLYDLYPFRILLVEDNRANQKLIERILEKEGYKIITADNGQICLDVMETEEADLIFMDYQMPVMDGPTASAEIRKKHGKEIIIIALTANVLEEDRKICRDSGMDDFISKPARPYDLREKISHWGQKKFNSENQNI